MFATAIRRVREGSGLSAGEAAERLAVGRGTLAGWELGHRPPKAETSARVLAELADAVSERVPGDVGRARGETAPAYVIAFTLAGTRYLADRRGRVLVFANADAAARAAGTLEEYLGRVLVVPTWRRYREGLPGIRGLREVAAVENAELAPVVVEALTAIIANAPRWLSAALARDEALT